MIEITNKLKCKNGHTYSLKKSNDQLYEYELIDEFGETINLVSENYLEDCNPINEEDQSELCVGCDYMGKSKYTWVEEIL